MSRTRIKTGISIAALLTAGLNTTMAAGECDVAYPIGGAVESAPSAAVEYQGELIAFGQITSADGLPVNGIIRFDGMSWQQLAHGISAEPGHTGHMHLLEYEGKLILTGGGVTPLDKDGKEVPVANVLTWDGESWGTFGDQECSWTRVAGVYQDDLVVGFYSYSNVGCEHPEFGFDDPIGGVARWNGEEWTQIGDTSDFDHVNALIEFDGDLIAGDHSGVIRRWDGQTWHVIAEADGHIHDFAILDGDLIVGGTFTEIDGKTVNCIARLEDGGWTDMDGGFSLVDSAGLLRVMALTMYNGQLHAGGRFDEASGTTTRQVARWTGKAWESIGQEILTGSVNDLTEYQGMLAGCGSFQVLSGPVIARRVFAHIGCEITGACCVDGGCIALAAEDCLAAGGTFHGDQSICAEVSCPPSCPADLNDDGAVGVLDLLMLLDNWGVCPE